MSANVVRASTPADGAEIVELCQRVLHVSATSPMFERSLLSWKYWRPWPTWTGARSYVIRRGADLLAHIAAIPVTYRHAGTSFTLLHPLDWAARPDVIGTGAMLLQKLGNFADGVLVVGGSSMTVRMLGPLGYRRLPDVCRYAAKPSGVRSGPLEVSEMVGDVVQPELGDVFDPQRVAARSPALVDVWRECPAIRARVCRVLEPGQAEGGFVLAQTPGQARVIDAWCNSSRPSDWARVYGAARSEAARHAVDNEVVTLANTPLEQQALIEAGFLECGRLPMHARSEQLPSEVHLRFQMIDGDAAFLHHGRQESWLA